MYHHLHIVAENQLATGIHLRRNHIHTLMLIQGHDTGFRQFVRQICPDHLTAIHADDRIYVGAGGILSGKNGCRRFCLALSGLHNGHIHIIINMRMIRGKMTGNDPDNRILIDAGVNFSRFAFHINTSAVFCQYIDISYTIFQLISSTFQLFMHNINILSTISEKQSLFRISNCFFTAVPDIYRLSRSHPPSWGP